MNPEYPVYIISKGRWENPLTAKALLKMKVPFSIVVEPQEYKDYAAVIAPELIKVLPFSNLGQGSIPARNWVWEDSIARGFSHHWILDDNIRAFLRLNRNSEGYLTSGAHFRAIEGFVERYENLALAGMQYEYIPKIQKFPPFFLNTRIYSCLLIQNDLPFRWRGKYNEDTDLSLRALKTGYCTILFNAFLIDKKTTMKMKGGNTDELYKGDGRLKMAQSLKRQHSDVVKVVWKWGRWQHSVDYRPFKGNKLILKPDIEIPKSTNEYGMKLVRKDNELQNKPINTKSGA